MTTAPTINGENIRLRAHVMDDLEAFWAFYQSPRACHMDVPNNKTHFWYGFASEIGSWPLTNMGSWAIETKDGTLAGQVGVNHPPHFAETELGWLLLDGFEGRGIAHEAATLALGYARDVMKLASLVSYIEKTNLRSIALAERLGAKLDTSGLAHDPDDLVYRHEVAA